MFAERRVFIAGAARIPTGRFLGGLSSVTAPQLGAIAIREAVRRSQVPPQRVDEVIMGQVVTAGAGQAPARQAALVAGLPPEVPALTINKVCGSGLKAAMLAAQAILAGDAEVIVAGGMESMSQAPYLLRRARTGYRMGHGELIDGVVHDGLWCAAENWHMGMAAEYIADEYDISREEMDEFALHSHRRAIAAIQAGRFKAEIVPVEVPGPKGSAGAVDTDETPRPDTSLEALAKLAPAFKPNGKVTAGNAPGLSDGAAAVVLISEKAAQRWGLKPMARVVGYASAAIAPKLLFAAPPLAIRRLMAKTGQRLEDYDLIEVNEAFAAQILANAKEMRWDWDRVNGNGGAVALGHPIGASGARLLTTLLYALRDQGGRRGLAALCLGGGGAVAMSIEIVE